MAMLNNQNWDANQQGYMDQHRVLIKSVWVIVTLLYRQHGQPQSNKKHEQLL